MTGLDLAGVAQLVEAGEWPPPSENGAADASLLDDVAAFVARYVACPPTTRDAAALWILHTHTFDAADCSPRFVLLSAEPQSGKTRFLEVLKLLVREPVFAVNVSDAALFRLVGDMQPTVLHDEIDAVFGPKARDREDLRAMLNAGYERGAQVQRCVGDGGRQRVESFPVFCPVAMAGLGKLPETVEQRSIIGRMKRRGPGESVAKLRRRQVGPHTLALRTRLETWAASKVASLAVAEPAMPEELDDRAQDIWEPLLAIADAAGQDWPERARTAARSLYSARRDDEATIGIRLLTDCREVFGASDGLASGDIAEALGKIEGAPWGEWSGQYRDRPISAHGLAKVLSRYDIKPKQHRIGSDSFRGYMRADFADAFSRYLPKEASDPDGTVPDGEADPSPGKCNIDESATPQAQQGQGLLHSDTCCTSTGTERDADGWNLADQLAALDPDDPDHGLHLAQLRAEDVHRRRAELDAP